MPASQTWGLSSTEKLNTLRTGVMNKGYDLCDP